MQPKIEKMIKEYEATLLKSQEEIKPKIDEIRQKLDEIGEICEKYGTTFTFEFGGLSFPYVSKEFLKTCESLEEDENDCYEFHDYFMPYRPNYLRNESGWTEFWNSSSLYC